MFNHGPMTPTLMDVVMLTGLNIHAADRPFRLLEKVSFKIETKSIGGWKGYIGKKPDQYLSESALPFSICDLRNSSSVAKQLVQQAIISSWQKIWLLAILFLSVNIFWGQFTTCFTKYHPDSERTSRSPTWEAPGGSFSCGCICTCTKL